MRSKGFASWKLLSVWMIEAVKANHCCIRPLVFSSFLVFSLHRSRAWGRQETNKQTELCCSLSKRRIHHTYATPTYTNPTHILHDAKRETRPYATNTLFLTNNNDREEVHTTFSAREHFSAPCRKSDAPWSRLAAHPRPLVLSAFPPLTIRLVQYLTRHWARVFFLGQTLTFGWGLGEKLKKERLYYHKLLQRKLHFRTILYTH